VAGEVGGASKAAMVVSLDRTHLVDGLAASGPAAGLGRPVLLVARDSVPSATSTALQSLGATDVWAVGGPTVISDAVVASLKARRVSGADRWSTAAQVGGTAVDSGLKGDTYVVASGETSNLVDALAGGAFAVPVLLSAQPSLPKPTWDDLYARRGVIQRAFVLGGTGAIGDTAAADVRHAISAP
jgi:putative cell wall-binding protein